MVLDVFIKAIGKEAKKEAKKSNNYRIACPNCGKELVKEVLLSEGCFACGWKSFKGEKK